MRTVNGPYIENFFIEDQHMPLTKILTKSQYYFCNVNNDLGLGLKLICQFNQHICM